MTAPKKPRPKRLRWILAIGGVLLAGACSYLVFFQWRPIGSGPAGPPVPSEPFRNVWSEREVLLLGIGDSVTAGLGAQSPDHSYFNRLLRNPADEYDDMPGRCLSAVLPKLKSLNLAVSGSTSIMHHETLKLRFEPQPATTFGIVVMTTGGNDLIHSYGRMPPKEGAMYGATLEQARPWIESFRQRLDDMLDLIDAGFPGGCRIFLADIYDPTDGLGDAPSVFLPDWPDGLPIHAEYNRILHACAAERDNVHLVPLHQTFLGHGSHCRQFWRKTYQWKDPHFWFHYNIEDPNDRGYDAIRRVFLLEMIDVFSDHPGVFETAGGDPRAKGQEVK
jgi:lysophospholipase L1-like esterase